MSTERWGSVKPYINLEMSCIETYGAWNLKMKASVKSPSQRINYKLHKYKLRLYRGKGKLPAGIWLWYHDCFRLEMQICIQIQKPDLRKNVRSITLHEELHGPFDLSITHLSVLVSMILETWLMHLPSHRMKKEDNETWFVHRQLFKVSQKNPQ